MNLRKLAFVGLLVLSVAVLVAVIGVRGCGHRPPAFTAADLQSDLNSATTNTSPPSATNAASRALTRFTFRPGTKVRIEGTANMIHPHWQVESPLIGGYLEVGPDFPTQPGQPVRPGSIEAHAETFIPVRSLRSVEDNGQPYSDIMDDIMYDKLKAKGDPKARITFHLAELTLSEPATNSSLAYGFQAKGDLSVAGVTNTITFPVSILVVGEKALKISATNSLKMTDFGVEPPAPKLTFGAIKTGNEIRVIFDWFVAVRTNSPANSPQ